jgi:quinol monooxygenase YgiN
MADPVIVFARFLAKAGQESALRDELLKMIAPTRDEGDNLFYDLHQSIEQPAVFMFHEGWRSAEALQRHMATPHFTAMDDAVQTLQAEPYSVVETNMISQATAPANA